MDKLTLFLKRFFILGVVIYALLSILYIINIPEGRGDEQLFINDLVLIKTEGWLVAIEKSISIPYLLLAYPLSLIIKNYIALRLVNLFLVIGLCLYFWKRNKPTVSFFAAFVFYISTVIFFFYGTNDALFTITLIVFFNEVFNIYENHSFKSSLAFTALICALFTRVLTLMYLPIIMLAFVIIYKHRKNIKFKFLLPLLFTLALLIINIPALKANGSLSYDFKVPPKAVSVTWVQRQYLAQTLVNKGKLQKGKHPSWEATQHYVNSNGLESLPKGILESVFFDVSLTIKEFFKDLFYAFIASIRQIGLVSILIIFMPLFTWYKNKQITYNMFVPVSYGVMLFFFSFIIISNVELRWLAPVFVMALVWYFNEEKNSNLSTQLMASNYMVFIALIVYGSFRVYNKMV